MGNNIENTIIVIVIDLAKPGNSVDNLLYWLDVVRQSSQNALKELSQNDPASFERLQNKVRTKWEPHEDAAKIKP